LGRSRVSSGDEKYDYLCVASLTILGVTRELVIKVAPGQHVTRGKFEMEKIEYVKPLFRFIYMENALKDVKIQEKDLKFVDTLPDPVVSYRKQVKILEVNYMYLNLVLLVLDDTEKSNTNNPIFRLGFLITIQIKKSRSIPLFLI